MATKTVTVEDRQNVYEFCKTQLGGKWAEVSEPELIINPITDGFVNKLFYSFLPENIKTKYNRVVVRYMDPMMSSFESFDPAAATAVALMVSEQKIAPKLLSISTIGTISECIECRYFNASDDQNKKTVSLLAQKLARLHSMQIPIAKNLLKNSFIDMFEKMFDSMLKPIISEEKASQAIKTYEGLSTLDLKNEIQWLKALIPQMKSPLVLSHNDMNRRNTLVRESKDSSDVEIFLIDFDWSNYNYRGTDFGQYFCSWGQKETDFGSGDFPTDQQMTVFIDAYISEMCKIFGDSYTKHEINSRESMIKESKIFTLMAFLKDILYCLWKVTQEIEILAKAETRYQCYCQLKKTIVKEYSIPA